MTDGTRFVLRYLLPVCIFLFSALPPGNLWAAAEVGSKSNKISPRMQSVIATHTLRIKEWAATPLLIEAVRAQNLKDTSLEEIKRIDAEWLGGKSDDLATTLLTNPAGRFLHERLRKNELLYTEAFLCDNKGAVVGEHPKTSDYWQGDEDKFIQSYNNGEGRDYIGAVKFDESTRTYSVQVSVPVLDDGMTIGVLVVGLKNI